MRLGYLFPIQWLPDILCFNFCTQETKLHDISNTFFLNKDEPLNELVNAPIDTSQTSILIEKSQYRLTLYIDKQPIKAYRVVFGDDPVNDKRREGDRRTPEGIFKVRDLYPHPSWSKFIWLDYPTQTSWQKHFEAKQKGEIKWSDTIGSEIGIHGVPREADNWIDEKNNWTWGCISLKNKDVDEIYEAIQTGTTIEIIP